MLKLKRFFTIGNLIVFGVLSFFLYTRGPQILNYYRLQGSDEIAQDSMINLDGSPIERPYPHVLLFWASWCAPCEIEMSRINSMIENGKIRPQQVISISIDSSFEEARRKHKQKGYLFPAVWDQSGHWARLYNVGVTPSLFVIDKNKKIIWATSGLSPLLELRLGSYLSANQP